MIAQTRKVTPPIVSDTGMVDFASIAQSNFEQLFDSAHVHVGKNGVLAAAPPANAGAVGDIVLVSVQGVVMLYFKVTAAQWYHLGPATKG